MEAGIAGPDQTICNGDTPGMITSSVPKGGSGNFQYQWQLSDNAGHHLVGYSFGRECTYFFIRGTHNYHFIQAAAN